MPWVTLDDGQHVYIAGGHVLATRSAISATAGGRARVETMRSKARGVAIKALEKGRPGLHAELDLRAAKSASIREQAQEAATAVPPHLHQGGKVFISDVHEQYRKQGGMLPLGEFKKHLVSTPEGRSRLARNDLNVPADRAKTVASEVTYEPVPGVKAEYHYVRAEQKAGTAPAVEHAKTAAAEHNARPSLREVAAAHRARLGQSSEVRARVASQRRLTLASQRQDRAQRIAMATPGSAQRQKIATTLKTLRSGKLEDAAKAYGGTINRYASGDVAIGQGIAVRTTSGRWIVQSQKEAARSYLRGVGGQVKRAVRSIAGRRVRNVL